MDYCAFHSFRKSISTRDHKQPSSWVLTKSMQQASVESCLPHGGAKELSCSSKRGRQSHQTLHNTNCFKTYYASSISSIIFDSVVATSTTATVLINIIIIMPVWSELPTLMICMRWTSTYISVSNTDYELCVHACGILQKVQLSPLHDL